MDVHRKFRIKVNYVITKLIWMIIVKYSSSLVFIWRSRDIGLLWDSHHHLVQEGLYTDVCHLSFIIFLYIYDNNLCLFFDTSLGASRHKNKDFNLSLSGFHSFSFVYIYLLNIWSLKNYTNVSKRDIHLISV